MEAVDPLAPVDAVGLSDEEAMREALRQAQCALDMDEVPVGCVVLDSARSVVAWGHNLTNRSCDPTQHAELVALQTLDTLSRAHTLVVTIEPCIMCSAALRTLFGHRLARVVFGARNDRFGGCGTVLSVLNAPDCNGGCGPELAPAAVTEGVLAEEAVALLKLFYRFVCRRFMC